MRRVPKPPCWPNFRVRTFAMNRISRANRKWHIMALAKATTRAKWSDGPRAGDINFWSGVFITPASVSVRRATFQLLHGPAKNPGALTETDLSKSEVRSEVFHSTMFHSRMKLTCLWSLLSLTLCCVSLIVGATQFLTGGPARDQSETEMRNGSEMEPGKRANVEAA